MHVLAPIKRPLSTENTFPSQKMMSFFAGSVSSTRSVPCRCLHPGFQNLLVRILIRFATRHPSGSRPVKEKVKIDGCEAERSHYLIAKQPSFFFAAPGPESGPQKNIGTPPEADKLVMSNSDRGWCRKCLKINIQYKSYRLCQD